MNPLCSTVGVTLLHSNTAECLPYEVNQPAKLSLKKSTARSLKEGGGDVMEPLPYGVPGTVIQTRLVTSDTSNAFRVFRRPDSPSRIALAGVQGDRWRKSRIDESP